MRRSAISFVHAAMSRLAPSDGLDSSTGYSSGKVGKSLIVEEVGLGVRMGAIDD
jgi:hypothetical protein